MESNPYAPPLADLYVPRQDAEAETLRKAHLNAEGNIQAIGGLYMIGAVFMFLGSLAPLPNLPTADTSEVVVMVVLLVFGVLQMWLGRSLRKLRPGARLPATLVTAIGLVGFPVGTIFTILFLYLLNNKRARFVFSPEYQAIRDATPHIKRKTSRFLLGFLGLLVLFIAGLFIWAIYFRQV